MNTHRRILFLLLVAQIGAAQTPAGTDGSQSDRIEVEDAFRQTVEAGLPPATLTNSAAFVLNHSGTAVPILLEAVRRKMKSGHDSDSFIWRATELIAYAASSDSMDAIAELCADDEARFSPLVSRTLDHAINWHREFDVAFYAAEKYPSLEQSIGKWVNKDLEFQLSDRVLAKTIIRRESAGISGERNEPLLRLLDAGARERLTKALSQLRRERPAR